MATIAATVKISGNVNTARLAVSTSPTMTPRVYSSFVLPNSYNFSKFVVNGLLDNTLYYFQTEVNGSLKGNIGKAKTPPTNATSFKFCLASCARDDSNHPIFDAIRGFNPDFFLHTGDIHYEDINVNDVDLYQAAYDLVFSLPKQEQLYREFPTFYMWDDHDYANDNSDSTNVSRPAAIQAFRDRVPFSSLLLDTSTATSPVYYKFNYGRCVFLVCDSRSQKSPSANADNSSKTVLGASQKAWLINEFNNNPGKFIFVLFSFGWMGTANPTNDWWSGYHTERVEIANAIKAAGIANRMMILSGDMHGCAYDSGANSDYATGGGAGVRVVQAAPLDQTNSTKGNGWSSGTFVSFQQQFGQVEVIDTGTADIQVNVSFHRYNAVEPSLTTQLFIANNTITLGDPPVDPGGAAWQQIRDLAIADGWAFLYDPANPDTRTLRTAGSDTFITSLSSSINSSTYPIFSQSTESKQPLLITNLIGSLSFGLYDITAREQLDAASFPQITNFSVMSITRSLTPGVSGTQPIFVAGEGTTSPNTRRFYFAHIQNALSMATNSNSGTRTASIDNTTYPISMGVHNSLVNKIFVNNVQIGTNTAATVPGTINKASIGSRMESSEGSASSGNMNGYIGIILGYVGEPPTDVATRMYNLINSFKV
ncbi:phosphatase [Anabaena phage Elbi]|nr:phosphatase [Anabaena phage Elbi]